MQFSSVAVSHRSRERDIAIRLDYMREQKKSSILDGLHNTVADRLSSETSAIRNHDFCASQN